jgi:hypothetical protein
MGYEMQPSFLRRRVLVAVAADDTRAIELVQAMRAQGLTVMIATTVGLASQADDVAVCVVVLHPEVWRATPAIVTAMRRNPRFMIPVLDEPMTLPRAAWATEPFYITDSPTQSAKALVTFIRHHLQVISERELASVMQRSMTIHPWLREYEPFEPPVITSKAPPRQLPHFLRLCWPLAFLLCVSVLTYYFLQLSSLSNSRADTQNSSETSTWLDHAYASAVPGADCDSGPADWEVPEYYKDVVPATAEGGITTATPQVIVDKSVTTTCQKDGLLLTHLNHYAAFASMLFASKGLPLPQHFKTQITATAINASSSAVFQLGVRDQSGSDVSDKNSGYGNDVLQVGVDGSWQVLRYNNSTDAVDMRFSKGFIKPAQRYTLTAESNGSLMTFSIDGQLVSTIIDPLYPKSYGISFGLSDAGAATAPSALFSQFTYEPLAATPQVLSRTKVAATAQAIHGTLFPYVAVKPGFDCDRGKGQWQPLSEAEGHVTQRCLATALAVSQKASEKDVGHIPFYWLDGNFPTSYKIQVLINLKHAPTSSAGLSVRGDAQDAGDAFFVRKDGHWSVVRYDDAGKSYQEASGHVAAHLTYTLETSSDAMTQRFLLNGVLVYTSQNISAITDHIELSMLPGSHLSPETTQFSDFLFTPLSRPSVW